MRCDNAPVPAKTKAGAGARFLQLTIADLPNLKQNLTLDVEQFDQRVHLVSDRVRDMLELAAFIYGADRLISRGSPSQVDYENWSRSLVFYIAVRDLDFWSQPAVSNALSQVLRYLSGDKQYQFHFSKKPASYQNRLFTIPPGGQPKTNDIPSASPEIALFSGGLDSLAGIIDLLATTSGKVVLTSHRANTHTTKVQASVHQQLEQAYPDRILYLPLECRLSDVRAVEETQRTRFFLYTAVAFAIAQTYGLAHINIFENGITSINLPKRQDLERVRKLDGR